jgi:hypothetical protein
MRAAGRIHLYLRPAWQLVQSGTTTTSVNNQVTGGKHMVRKSGAKKMSVKLRHCVLGAMVASVLASAVQAQTSTTTLPSLNDAVMVTMGMRMRENVAATLPVNAKKAFPSLTEQQLTCLKASSVGPMVSSYANSIRMTLTKDEVARAKTFYASAEGKSYVSKLLSATQLTPTATAPAVTLTAAEQTALNSFLATTAGQKLIRNKSYVTATLNTEVSGHIAQLVKGCPA